MSFLQRLKGRGVRADQKLLSTEEETAIDKVAQLNVDVFQAEEHIVIYAQAAGADMSDIHVSIEGDADIVLIEGRRVRPEFLAHGKRRPEGAYVTEECVWGEFYRRIILPDSIDIDNAEAKIKHGVLVLKLPLMLAHEKEKVKLKITQPKTNRRVS
jgi:HSP20 family protein